MIFNILSWMNIVASKSNCTLTKIFCYRVFIAVRKFSALGKMHWKYMRFSVQSPHCMRIRTCSHFQIQCVSYGKWQNPDRTVHIAVKRLLNIRLLTSKFPFDTFIGSTPFWRQTSQYIYCIPTEYSIHDKPQNKTDVYSIKNSPPSYIIQKIASLAF